MDILGALAPVFDEDNFVLREAVRGLVKLIDKDLSEPYSIFTYRYSLYNWSQLSILARVQHKLVDVIIWVYSSGGATPAVEKQFRHRGIGSQLAQKAIERMRDDDCEEVYGNLGFVRDERLVKYYLNGGDAYRLKLWLQIANCNR
ncbi:hypothetical protein V7S43_003913 [Phytophthora oleae]|uniref:N-acetyltransferase domain-containing protein n=1 Tax=Phytophthora oleae TaxID=2107226 RepID=A0ABD3FUW9_9STRA